MEKVKEKKLSVLESLGAIGFIALAFLGIFMVVDNNAFFKNFLANSNTIFGSPVVFGETAANINSAGALPFMNFAVGLKVIAGLFAIVLIMAYATTYKEGEK
jgi:multisubunit Na+/H+ antiporter MnhB subunit